MPSARLFWTNGRGRSHFRRSKSWAARGCLSPPQNLLRTKRPSFRKLKSDGLRIMRCLTVGNRCRPNIDRDHISTLGKWISLALRTSHRTTTRKTCLTRGGFMIVLAVVPAAESPVLPAAGEEKSSAVLAVGMDSTSVGVVVGGGKSARPEPSPGK